jgi:ankyrin repeat protein
MLNKTNIIDNLFSLFNKKKYNEITKILTKILEEKKKDEFKYSDFDINTKDTFDNYLLNYAVMQNKYNISKLIIELGANLDILDSENRTLLYYTIKYNYTDITDLILKQNNKKIGVSILDIQDSKGNIPLHYAIKSHNIDIVKKLLNAGSNILKEDKYGNNALHLSIYYKDIDIFNLILEQKIDINRSSYLGETPLHLAVNLKQNNIVKILLKHKDININIQDKENGFTPFEYAININNVEIIELLLKDKRTDFNIQDNFGNTALHYAIIQNLNDRIIFKIIEKSNCNLWNNDGELPLHLIFKLNLLKDKELIDKLIEHTNLNIQDNEGNSCLFYLIKNNLWKNYKDLLKNKKLDIFIKNSKNKRIIEYISNNDIEEFINLVIDSYYNSLQKKNNKWSNNWENNCTSNKMSEKECKKNIKEHILEILESTNTNICLKKSYPIKSDYICLDINKEQKQKICSFTGSTLDILIGLIYLLKKHKNVCSIIDKKINKSSELCNFYKKLGIMSNSRCEFFNYEIVWAYNNLFITEAFKSKFLNCVNNKDKKYIIVPLGIETENGNHANYLIYDIEKQELERFEPHGSSSPISLDYETEELDKLLKYNIQNINKNIKYISPKDFLPKVGLQTFDIKEYNRKRIGDPAGFCALWSIWYVDMRITYDNLDRKTLINAIIKEFKSNNISFKNTIRNYSKNITEIRDKILEKANIDINDWLYNQPDDMQMKIIIGELSKEIS